MIKPINLQLQTYLPRNWSDFKKAKTDNCGPLTMSKIHLSGQNLGPLGKWKFCHLLSLFVRVVFLFFSLSYKGKGVAVVIRHICLNIYYYISVLTLGVPIAPPLPSGFLNDRRKIFFWQFWMGDLKCTQIQSFGGLHHFKASQVCQQNKTSTLVFADDSLSQGFPTY